MVFKNFVSEISYIFWGFFAMAYISLSNFARVPFLPCLWHIVPSIIQANSLTNILQKTTYYLWGNIAFVPKPLLQKKTFLLCTPYV